MEWTWPPRIPELGEVIKNYYLDGSPLSIAGESGIIRSLEQHFAALHRRKYALAVSSGTMALYSAFWALDLRPGDEVICTSFTYHATAAPLLHFGVHIIFCDVEQETGNIDASLLENLISPRTRAIITNDQWGHPCDKESVLEVCNKYDLRYIEDCSHAHFSSYNSRYCGEFGDIACWSLQGAKLLSGGEGGILLTDDQDLFERAVLLGHNLKRSRESVHNPRYKELERTGYGLKLRMHPLAALLVDWQLENRCFQWIESRNATLSYFQNRLASDSFLKPMVRKPYVSSMGAWYGFMPLLPQDLDIDREHLVNWLNDQNIQASLPKSPPLPNLSLFSDVNFKIGDFNKAPVNKCPIANKYFQSIISFPTWTFYEYDEIDRCIYALQEYQRLFL